MIALLVWSWTDIVDLTLISHWPNNCATFFISILYSLHGILKKYHKGRCFKGNLFLDPFWSRLPKRWDALRRWGHGVLSGAMRKQVVADRDCFFSCFFYPMASEGDSELWVFIIHSYPFHIPSEMVRPGVAKMGLSTQFRGHPAIRTLCCQKMTFRKTWITKN